MTIEDDEKERAKLVRNESVKLSATYLNGTAIATFAVGGLTVPFNGMLQGQPSAAVGTIALICALASFALHFMGRILLKNLR